MVTPARPSAFSVNCASTWLPANRRHTPASTGAADLQDWARHEWLIENQITTSATSPSVKTFHARTGSGPAVMATLRNASIGYHRTNGETNIARATRRANRRPHDLITNATSDYPRTQ